MSTRGFTLGEGGSFPGHLYVMNADGTGLRQVTRQPLTSSLGPQDWTRDGRGLLLSREVDGQIDILRVDLESGEETWVTSDPAAEYGAAVAPDGRRLAFHAEAAGESHVVVMAMGGTARRVLTRGPGLRYTPRWSPDGAWLAFASRQEGDQYDVRAIRVADGFERALVATPEDERDVDWRPRRPAGGRP